MATWRVFEAYLERMFWRAVWLVVISGLVFGAVAGYVLAQWTS